METRALDTAMAFEEKIALFYLAKGKDAANPLVRRLFLTLARQEIDHMLFIDEAAAAAGETAGTGDAGAVEAGMKDFFTRAAGADLRKDAGNAEAVEAAMALEKEGWEMYRRFRDAASGADREFFSRLLEQEIKHLESLQNVHYYLTGTGDWLEGEESRVWNWMNT